MSAFPPPLVELVDVARHFDVSPPWLNRVLERQSRTLLKAVDGVSFAMASGIPQSLIFGAGPDTSTPSTG